MIKRHVFNIKIGKIMQIRGRKRKSTHTTLGPNKTLLQRKDLVDITGNLTKISAE